MNGGEWKNNFNKDTLVTVKCGQYTHPGKRNQKRNISAANIEGWCTSTSEEEAVCTRLRKEGNAVKRYLNTVGTAGIYSETKFNNNKNLAPNKCAG